MTSRTGGRPPSSRTGGGSRTNRTGARPATLRAPVREEVTHRGIRWRKDPDGTLGWYNEGRGAWVRYHPDGDNPPVPPQWQADADRIPGRPRRPAFRSPWRIIPLILAVVVVAVGAAQALRATSNPAGKADAQARALVGRCLARTSGSGASAVYGSTPVPCTAADAAVRVVAVRPVTTGPVCPAGATALQVSYYGVRAGEVECVEPVRHP